MSSLESTPMSVALPHKLDNGAQACPNRKAGTPVPDWIDQWPKDESDEYYENLAQEFGLVP